MCTRAVRSRVFQKIQKKEFTTLPTPHPPPRIVFYLFFFSNNCSSHPPQSPHPASVRNVLKKFPFATVTPNRQSFAQRLFRVSPVFFPKYVLRAIRQLRGVAFVGRAIREMYFVYLVNVQELFEHASCTEQWSTV